MGNFFISFLKESIIMIRSRLKLSSLLLRLKKIFTAVQIIGYIIAYFIKKWAYFLWVMFNGGYFKVELKSFLFVLILSFFFYYFIVVELSIRVFGYSLLCY